MLSASALSYESPTLPTERTTPASASRSVERIAVYWVPRSLWCTTPSASGRACSACSSASSARSLLKEEETRHPTMRREKTSVTKAT